MRMLIVEDEPAIRKQLIDYFSSLQFVVDHSEEGVDGAFRACEYDYDIAIVDLGLPNKDGVSVVKELRAAEKKYPVLILTARGDWQDKVNGLEAGADDYLVKPFHEEELKARVNALIRRASGNAQSILTFQETNGELELDLSAKHVNINGEQLDLTSYEYNTLEYLCLNSSKVISKTELTEHLYHEDFERDSNVIEVFVGRLRKKLSPLDVIKTVRGQGYRFTADKN